MIENMEFPEGDSQFSDAVLSEVSAHPGGWTVTINDGWSLLIPSPSPVEPEAGMHIRLYGRGHGRPVRGVFLDGRRVFYRTEREDEEHREIEMYGADAADWLKRWDEGRSVWSIEMGGLGPAYEQCIHITAAEILRHLLDAQYDPAFWEDDGVWKRDRDVIEKAGFANERIKALGLSGAQWGAALNLALHFYREGPRKVMTAPEVEDRHIQVSRSFPSLPA